VPNSWDNVYSHQLSACSNYVIIKVLYTLFPFFTEWFRLCHHLFYPFIFKQTYHLPLTTYHLPLSTYHKEQLFSGVECGLDCGVWGVDKGEIKITNSFHYSKIVGLNFNFLWELVINI
jgi:hypothetical protein